MKTTRPLAALLALLAMTGAVLVAFAGASGAEPYSPKPRPTNSPSTAPRGPATSTPSRAGEPSRRGVLSLQTTRPGRGGTMSGRCEGTTPGDRMAIELVSNGHTYRLATARADRSGGMTFRVTLPPSVVGTAAMNCMDMTTGSILSTSTIAIGVDAAAANNVQADQQTGGEQHDGVAYTGAAVIGVGVLGLALLAGGVFLLVAGRRRARV